MEKCPLLSVVAVLSSVVPGLFFTPSSPTGSQRINTKVLGITPVDSSVIVPDSVAARTDRVYSKKEQQKVSHISGFSAPMTGPFNISSARGPRTADHPTVPRPDALQSRAFQEASAGPVKGRWFVAHPAIGGVGPQCQQDESRRDDTFAVEPSVPSPRD